MKIRDKLFYGFGIYLFLSALFGFLAYRDISVIDRRLGFLELADDVTISMLEVRRYEKNFLLYRDSYNLTELTNYIASLKNNIERIRHEIIIEVGSDDYEKMRRIIIQYESLILRIAENFKAQEQAIISIRDEGRRLEAGLSGKSLNKFLVARRYEKNLMLYKDKETFDTFAREFAASGLTDKNADEYAANVKRLFGLYQKESALVEQMRIEAREIQSITVKLSRKERLDIATTLKMSRQVFLIGILVILIIGTLINIRLSNSIAKPIRKLERITNKVATGDLTESIDVEGGDEIAALAESFNIMEAKLKTALSSLEDKVRELETKQAQLVESEKLASIGLLVAGVAHEINNPLTSVLTFSHLMLEQLPEDDPNRDRVRMMASETSRVRTIVRQMLSFARETPLRPITIDINRPVTEITESLIATGKFKDIELTMNLYPEMPEITADPAQIGQVVMNLLLNAVHAITPPGSITVATRLVPGWAEIIVTDTGCGIPAENLKHIFEPFFTTRETNEGTGLGLAVSYGIIKKHRGDVEVVSELGHGTTFTVRLPHDRQA